MNVKSTIDWATPYSLGLLLAVAVAAVAGFALLRWASGRPIAPARRPGLLVLRLAILAIVALIIVNPVRVDLTPGMVELPKLFYLLDTSQSMAIGKDMTRWEQVVRTIRDADGARGSRRRGPGEHVSVRQSAGGAGRGLACGRREPSPRSGARPVRSSPQSPRAPPNRRRRQRIPTRYWVPRSRVSPTDSARPRLRRWSSSPMAAPATPIGPTRSHEPTAS